MVAGVLLGCDLFWVAGCRDRKWGLQMLCTSYCGTVLLTAGFPWFFYALGLTFFQGSAASAPNPVHLISIPCLAIGTGLCYWIHRQMDPAGPNFSRLGIHGWQQYPPVAGGSSLFVNR